MLCVGDSTLDLRICACHAALDYGVVEALIMFAPEQLGTSNDKQTKML